MVTWKIVGVLEVSVIYIYIYIYIYIDVLKVWMHNNKNAHRRRESGPDYSPSEPPQQQKEQRIGS